MRFTCLRGGAGRCGAGGGRGRGEKRWAAGGWSGALSQKQARRTGAAPGAPGGGVGGLREPLHGELRREERGAPLVRRAVERRRVRGVAHQVRPGLGAQHLRRRARTGTGGCIQALRQQEGEIT